MDPSDFADGPAQSQLLTKDEALAILLNLSSPHKKYPMPDGFSLNHLPRKNPSQKLVCLSRKSYMHRPIEERSVQLSNGCLTDELYFKTSDDITLLGIQVSELFPCRTRGKSGSGFLTQSAYFYRFHRK